MARGGRRAGNRGTPHPQRTDLALPVAAPQGLPYGDAGKLKAAQRAVPMAQAPTPGPAAPAQGQLPTAPPPGHFLRPTERPGEPVTAGLPTGPGPGPEALSPLTQGAENNGGSSVAGLLSGLASAPGATDEVKQLASYSQGAK